MNNALYQPAAKKESAIDEELEAIKISWIKVQDDLKTSLFVRDNEEWQKERYAC